MATNTTMGERNLAEVRRAFTEWIQARCSEGEQLLVDVLAVSPRYYFFEQNTSQYATEFFNRIDRWRRWVSALITGLRRRVRFADHLIEDVSARFAEAQLLVFTIRDLNEPTVSKLFDLRERASISNGAGWLDIRQWFGRGQEEPAWNQVRQSLLAEVRSFAAMVLEQVDDLQLNNIETGSEIAATPAIAASPSRIDQSSRFTEREARGEGAHAAVWKALDTELGRVVALRIVQPSAGGDLEAIAHARTMAKPPQHPNIVTVYELASIEHPVERRPVIAAVMEFVDGDKLRNVCKRQLPGPEALRLCAGIVAALRHYHEHGFAHLDLHEDNVLVTKSMEVKVLDPKTYRTEMFATTQLLRDQIRRDIQDAVFLLRSILKNSELNMEIAVAFQETASNATSIDDLQAALATATAVPSAGPAQQQFVTVQPQANPGTLPDITDASAVLSTALVFARTNDQIGWRQLEDHLRREFVERLHPWRAEHEPRWAGDRVKDGCFATTDKLLDLAMGRFVIALAGVYSNNPAFIDQRHVVEDLLSLPNWNRGGTTAIVEAPRTLVFLLHYIHGALCLARRQTDLALQFAQVAVADRQRNETRPLWAEHDVTGWPKLLGETCTWAWEYLRGMRQRRSILEQFFVLPTDYDVGLAAYSMMLSLNELAMDAAKAAPTSLTETDAVMLDFPPLFVGMSRETIEIASRRTFGDRQLVENVARRAGAEPETMRQLWPSWKKLIIKFGRDVFQRYSYLGGILLGDLA